MKKVVSNITLGYSDSEDRIWARLIINNDNEAQIWLTRKICHSLCKGIAESLEKNIPDHGGLNTPTLAPEKYLEKEFFEASISTWEKAPPAQTSLAPNQRETISQGLCHKITINTNGKNWQIIFLSAKNCEFVIQLNRTSIYKILIGLLKNSQTARWNLGNIRDWIKEDGVKTNSKNY